MNAEKEIELGKIFKIENPTVEETQHWAENVAKIDTEHLRSCLVAGGELCDLCLSLSAYYEKRLVECRNLIEEGKGDPVINEKRLPLLEIGERTNNLSGYLALLQMDAMMSLINLLEAKSDVERLLNCKHAYTIIYDAKIKGLFKVVSREMRKLPEDVLPYCRSLHGLCSSYEAVTGIQPAPRSQILVYWDHRRCRNTDTVHMENCIRYVRFLSWCPVLLTFQVCRFGMEYTGSFFLYIRCR